MSQSKTVQFPLLQRSTQEFTELRKALQDACYSEETFFKTLNVDRMSDTGGLNFADIDFSSTSPQFEVLFRLFFGQRALPFADLQKDLGPRTTALLSDFDFIAKASDPGNVYAKVLLYPVENFLIASDRHSTPDGSAFEAPEDIVFPAIFGGTLNLLRILPKSECDDALDVCAGTGIGAFALSRYARHAVSSDLTARATHFANFNRALNGLDNVEVVCGDLFSAVGDREFDRIVAHPPYVPSVNNSQIWRDGGVTGEALTQRIIEGIPAHLRPGGICCIMSLGLDTKEGAFEDRVRTLLGSFQSEFDIIFAATDERVPAELLRDLLARDPTVGPAEYATLRASFEDAGIVRMPHGALVMRRHLQPEDRPAWSFRTRLSEVTSGSDFENFFAFHPHLFDPAYLKQIANGKPALAPRLQVNVTHVVFEGALVPGEYIFETDKPFEAKGRVDSWMVPLFLSFDGNRTSTEIYETFSHQGSLPEGFQLDDFLKLVARMIERGFLTFEFQVSFNEET